MVRRYQHRLQAAVMLAILLFLSAALRGAPPSAYDLLPSDTQAVVWVRDGEELVDRWEQTQLARLAEDDAVAPFFEARRNEIRDRLMEAGWRLKIQPEDLADYSTGQLALAWSVKQDSPLKPYITMLLADVDDNPTINARMLADFDKQLQSDSTTKKTMDHRGITITHYRLPPRPGELLHQDTFVAIARGLLIVTDDQAMEEHLIDMALGERGSSATLSTDEVFQQSRQLASVDGRAQVEYFVRPLGFARLVRAMSGNRSKNSADILAILENQGFDAILGVAGQLVLGQEKLDIEHRGFVLVRQPLPKSAAALDFPNEVPREVPSFVTGRVATLVATSWNVEEAFWRLEGLVDDFAGTQGVFDEVIEGLKHDPTGPQVDVAADVLPNLTNDIYAVTDNKEGEVQVDSRRNMIAIRVKDSQKMQQVVDKAMKGEPDAERLEVAGHSIWKVVHREDQSVEGLDDFSEFGDFEDFGTDENAASEEPEPLLSNWAITVYGDYLFFASHVEMIEQAIRQMEETDVSPLVEQRDYQRARAALEEVFGNDHACAWQVVRSDRAYRVQYELFRKGELRRSQSMLATILDRLLKDEDLRKKDQVIKGEGLPEFDYIKKFLQPGATIVRTTADGWTFGSVLLSPAYDVADQGTSTDTARTSQTESASNR
ncbi:MAG: hypothetical protein KatS3mg111_1972 [Pirellulaceae bacterium]|nr:MAG: hypothetical protein KatS3mg111_1972 [Pirellulaceae bacterium]